MLEHLGEELTLRFPIGGMEIAFNLVVMAVAVAVAGGLVLLSLWIRRGLSPDPDAPLSRRAALVAAAIDFFRDQLLGGVSPQLGERLLPLVATLFLYVLVCNWIGILPVPHIVSPTQDLNVALGLALLVYGSTHYYGVRTKGVRRHVAGYFEPFPFLMPLNIIGDFGRTLSHGFRLFGNILGGALLTAVTPVVVLRIADLIPVVGGALGWAGRVPLVLGLHLVFGLFFGGIQALVFALLAAAYIQVTAD